MLVPVVQVKLPYLPGNYSKLFMIQNFIISDILLNPFKYKPEEHYLTKAAVYNQMQLTPLNGSGNHVEMPVTLAT